MCEQVLPNYLLKQACTEWVLNKYSLRCNYLLAAHLRHLKIIPRQADKWLREYFMVLALQCYSEAKPQILQGMVSIPTAINPSISLYVPAFYRIQSVPTHMWTLIPTITLRGRQNRNNYSDSANEGKVFGQNSGHMACEWQSKDSVAPPTLSLVSFSLFSKKS